MSAPTLPPARRPLGPGAISVIGVLLALVAVLLGALGVRDALVRAGALPGEPWVDALIRGVDGLRPQWWGVPIGALAALLGAWLVLAAVWPRPRTALTVRSRTGVVVRRRAVARLAVRAAYEVDGVLNARAQVGRRRVGVAVLVTGEEGNVAGDVQQSVEERLAVLEPPPRVRVRARAEADA